MTLFTIKPDSRGLNRAMTLKLQDSLSSVTRRPSRGFSTNPTTHLN
jgi:hypothetical protein